MKDTLVHGKFEYNGFRYEIHEDDEGKVYAIPWRDRIKPHEATLYLTKAMRAFEEEYGWSQRSEV